MGKFIGVVAAALSRDGDSFQQTMEHVEFGGEVWVYYCRPHRNAPPAGWRNLADGTLRASWDPPPDRHEPITWEPHITCGDEGVCRYRAEVMQIEAGNNLFHLALPAFHLPLDRSWDIAPLYGHADGDRFVIGWAGFEYIWPSFRFRPVEEAAFAEEATALDEAIAELGRKRRADVFSPWRQTDTVDSAALLSRLDGRLDEDGTRTLVFELGLDYDNLAGTTKVGKLREMLLFLERNQQLPRLVVHLDNSPAYAGLLDESNP